MLKVMMLTQMFLIMFLENVYSPPRGGSLYGIVYSTSRHMSICLNTKPGASSLSMSDEVGKPTSK